ncbi:MAG: AraC family ligand binding domain-containing protein, partial [Gorillibacterium sp.]|nr:AraC family ligand binding domain-containing protein [Gorillibacterium sp.]
MSKQSSPYAIYGFRFFETSPTPQYGLYAVGYERITSPTYEWDGSNRSDGPLYLFQYTKSGSGLLNMDGQTHRVEPGSAFLLEIPSNHRYYYPSSEEPWEFYFMLFRPDGLQEEWARIKKRLGFLPQISSEQSVIHLLEQIYHEARNGAIADAYRASSAVYRFIMELGRYSANQHLEAVDWPPPIKQAAEWMKAHLASLQNLDDICQQAGLSKYHFIRRFSQSTGYSP